jgi:hypothetical protein
MARAEAHEGSANHAGLFEIPNPLFLLDFSLDNPMDGH